MKAMEYRNLASIQRGLPSADCKERFHHVTTLPLYH